MSSKSAQELFPNLFAAKPAAPQRQARELAPADMRLLQWAMRQQARRNGPAAPQPSRLAPRAAAPARPAPRPAPRQLPAR